MQDKQTSRLNMGLMRLNNKVLFMFRVKALEI